MAKLSLHAEVPGLLTDQVAVAFPIHTVSGSPLAPSRVDAWLVETAATDTVVRIGDGTSDHTLTIPAGQQSAGEAISAITWPDGAAIEVEVTSAPGYEAATLQLNLLVAETQPSTSAVDGLVSLAELKAALGITGATAEQDAYLTRQIAVSSELVRAYCRRHFSRATYRATWYYPSSVFSADTPLEQILAATLDGAALTPASDLGYNARTGEIWRVQGTGRSGWSGVQNLSLDYIAGSDPIPAPVAECLYVGISARWKTWDADRGLAPQPTIVGMTFPDAGSLQFRVASTLGPSDLVHALAGFPLTLLDPYVDLGRSFADVSEAWTFL